MYFYHAHTMALGGTLTRPHQLVIEPQAACSLPITGGRGSSRSDDYNFNGMISFRSAQVDVAGSQDGSPAIYSTRSSAIIEDLNVLNVVTADRVVASLTSRHVVGQEESSILTSGCYFENLKISGVPVTLELGHDLLNTYNTYQNLSDAFGKEPTKDPILQRLLGSGFEPGDGTGIPQHLKDIHNIFQRQKALGNLDKTVVCSFVKSVTAPGFVPYKSGSSSEIQTCGPIVIVPHFGTIFIGEVIISHGMRRVNMLRMELGSPDGGTLAVASGTNNGTSFPPT